jgi:hypothetical protein
LDKMILEIEDVRPQVISSSTYLGLLELLKFRHFSRYYFELDYDWDKLKFLLKKFNDIHVQVRMDISDFERFLDKLNSL